MFGIGGWEFMLIAVLALLLFGPDKLPQFARTIGRFMRDFNRYKDILESTLRAEIYTAEQTPDETFKKGKEFREKVQAGEYGATGASEGAQEAEGEPEPTPDAADAPPADRATGLPEDHPLAAAVAAGEDVGIDDDLDLSTLDAGDFGWTPGKGESGGGEGEGA